MGNETRRILDLLAQGKITADEAEQLMTAVQPPPAPAAGDSLHERVTAAVGWSDAPPAATDGAKQPPKWLRVSVFKQRLAENPADPAAVNGYIRKKEVNVRIPLSLARAGLKLGAIMPGLAGDKVNQQLREHGIDLSKIDPADIEDVMKELGDMTIDVEDGKHQVRIFCE
jgi:hypothetical protein